MKEDSNNIVQRIRQGDSSCLEELVIAYKNYCTNGLRKKVGCTGEEAEELFIDALLELRDKILEGKLDRLINTKSYIFGICQNMWLAQKRQERKTLEKKKDIEIYYSAYLENDFLFSQNGADYKMQLIEIAYQALESIDEKCRMIIKYFYLEKRSMDEIAELLDFASPDVAKTSKSRCFKKLVDKAKELEQS
ncbi:RNA polymerase, sigma-E factor [Fulvivirga imtechensis AK7]|uniref:RNA polymerase, sigma-E factor n=1 Tax=Fulvivirga imtechensis AK7 TaxID=1237149 RepID=L8JZN0_9BACT|nr:sigma-70 family RNA polymerase sigma factor [Fulvivirga imtechensis]ELR73124.1 RNA polymerase, sigma-E factor [Fulvivirga imtechensis AK7]